ncbi:MAG: hypothetical protein ACKVJG_29180, partial [Candidatus Latescibacterota bacterium]
PWDFSTGHFVAALYSGQMTQIDTGVVHNFSLGGTAPAPKPVAHSSAINHRDEVEITLRRKERELANRIRTEGWRAAKLVQAAYQVGDKRSFVFAGLSGLGVPDQSIFATAVAINERAVAFVQDDLRADTNNIDNAGIQQAIDRFSDDFELIADVFGAPSDIDGDGKLLFLFTHLVPWSGGFYDASSVLPVENGGNGNNADMMVISSTISPNPDYNAHVLVHELQHLINFNQHVIVRSGLGEASWLNEGLSHLSEDLAQNGLDLVEKNFQVGMGRTWASPFLSQPSTVGLMGNATFNMAKRGAAYLFVRSLADRFGLDVIRRLTQTGLADRDNIETASGEKFEDLLAIWAAQIYASGNGLVDHPHLNYAFNLLHPSAGRGFPLPTTLQFSPESGPISGTLRARGVNFVEVRGEGITTIEIETEAAGQVGAIVLPLFQQDHEECPFIYTAAFCETEALTKGLRIGGEGYDFEDDYGTKGCYAYDSGTYEGIAFFGTGGDAADMEAEAQTA